MRRLILTIMLQLLAAPLTLRAQNSEPASAGPPAEAGPPPAPEGAPPAPSEVAPPTTTAPTPVHHHKKHVRRRHRRHKAAPVIETDVEPATARLRVKTAGAPIYAQASSQTEQIGTLSLDKYVQVTGSTRSYLQVQLKDGRTGYIQPSSVYMVKPYDKQFLLTADSPVFSAPNQWGNKVAEVHRGRYIHVVGQALAYLKIHMKDGTEGYVPMTAAQ